MDHLLESDAWYPQVMPGGGSNASRQVVNIGLAHGFEALEHHGGSPEHCLERRNLAHRDHGILDEHALRNHDVKWNVNAFLSELILYLV